MRLTTAAVLTVLAAHGGPAATWLPGLRRACFPALAGMGRPDHVALTFDDGPDPDSTPWFLEALDACAVRVTFFVLGDGVRRYPGLARRMAERGHEVAVHGWTHDRPWAPAPRRDIRDLARAAEAIYDAAGQIPRWYRPPTASSPAADWPRPPGAGCGPCCGRRGAGTGRPARRRCPCWLPSGAICGAAARSCCTIPTGPRRRAAGVRRSGHFPGW